MAHSKEITNQDSFNCRIDSFLLFRNRLAEVSSDYSPETPLKIKRAGITAVSDANGTGTATDYLSPSFWAPPPPAFEQESLPTTAPQASKTVLSVNPSKIHQLRPSAEFQ